MIIVRRNLQMWVILARIFLDHLHQIAKKYHSTHRKCHSKKCNLISTYLSHKKRVYKRVILTNCSNNLSHSIKSNHMEITKFRLIIIMWNPKSKKETFVLKIIDMKPIKTKDSVQKSTFKTIVRIKFNIHQT